MFNARSFSHSLNKLHFSLWLSNQREIERQVRFHMDRIAHWESTCENWSNSDFSEVAKSHGEPHIVEHIDAINKLIR